MSITDAILQRTRSFEGSISHMYLDTVGKVTMGVGHMIPSAAAAEKLPLIDSATSELATAARKRAEFAEIRKQAPGKRASAYKRFTTLTISDDDADSLLQADLSIAEEGLRAIFSGYDNFPAAAQAALVDMAFNLGRAELRQFKELIAACKAGDWKRAGVESRRQGTTAKRNAEIRDLFASIPAGVIASTQLSRVVSRQASRGAMLASAAPESCREGRCIHSPLAMDFIIRQHIPNISEADASGPIKRKIRRDDPEFRSLVSNTNDAIRFKDEEGTGADRMMSPRLRDALDKLAEATRSEWPGTRLRVTEAWDENNEHHGTSLHYEGRAADLTTDPIDAAKLGRLARIATTCGFDWVLYENEAHLHVSVRNG